MGCTPSRTFSKAVRLLARCEPAPGAIPVRWAADYLARRTLVWPIPHLYLQ
jgi:hypothetical protein